MSRAFDAKGRLVCQIPPDYDQFRHKIQNVENYLQGNHGQFKVSTTKLRGNLVLKAPRTISKDH